jgi:hypothetical protein
VTSQKQIAANRRNASKSTGPRTVGGKTISRGNAVKHGILSSAVVAEGEDASAFDVLHSGLRDQFQPVTALEEQLVEKLAMAFWRNRRLAIAEKVIIDARRANLPPASSFGNLSRIMMQNGIPKHEDMMLLGRYQVMVTNEIQRTLAMLRKEQALRDQTIDVGPTRATSTERSA